MIRSLLKYMSLNNHRIYISTIKMSLVNIGLILFLPNIALSAEYELPFRRAQAWADFFVVELNNEILKVGLDGKFSSAHYKLPIQSGCKITALNYRPIVPMGQLLLNYESRCHDASSLVYIVKVEKIGTTVKQLFDIAYAQSDLGPGLWQDELLILTARGTILVFNHKNLQTVFFNSELQDKFQAFRFIKVRPWTKGYRFEYDTGIAFDSRKFLCLSLPQAALNSCP